MPADPVDRLQSVTNALRSLQAMSHHIGQAPMLARGNGMGTLLQLLGNEIEDATADLMMMMPARRG